MNIATLIADLQAIQERHGNIPVAVKQVTGQYISRIGVGSNQANMVLGDADDTSPVAVISCYVILSRQNTE